MISWLEAITARLFLRHHEQDEEPARAKLPKKVREASHELANEVTQLHARTRQLKDTDDPFVELARVLGRVNGHDTQEQK